MAARCCWLLSAFVLERWRFPLGQQNLLFCRKPHNDSAQHRLLSFQINVLLSLCIANTFQCFFVCEVDFNGLSNFKYLAFVWLFLAAMSLAVSGSGSEVGMGKFCATAPKYSFFNRHHNLAFLNKMFD